MLPNPAETTDFLHSGQTAEAAETAEFSAHALELAARARAGELLHHLIHHLKLLEQAVDVLDLHTRARRDTALAAYNAGMGNVSKWLKNPEYSSDGITLSYIPFKETREYVAKVNDYERTYKELYDLGKNIKKRKSEAVNSSDGKE